MSKIKISPYVTIRGNNGVEYYFNNNGILESRKGNDYLHWNTIYQHISIDTENAYIHTKSGYINITALKKAISKLKVGDSIETFEKIIDETKIEKREKPSGVDRFITKVEKPVFERVPENKNKKTFDFIRIDVGVLYDFEGKMKYIRKNYEEICNIVLKKIEESKVFKSYGIPINFLKLGNVTFIKSMNIIQFLFEIKGI